MTFVVLLSNRKNEAEGTPTYQHAVENCAKTIAEAHRKYLIVLRSKIEALPRNSKRWWKLNSSKDPDIVNPATDD